MSSNIALLREKLSHLGISTKTPGVRGEERLRILQDRLESHTNHTVNQLSSEGRKIVWANSTAISEDEVFRMSTTQIRRTLERETISTRTPGLRDTARHEELCSRLIRHLNEIKMQHRHKKIIIAAPNEKTESTSQVTVEESKEEDALKKTVAHVLVPSREIKGSTCEEYWLNCSEIEKESFDIVKKEAPSALVDEHENDGLYEEDCILVDEKKLGIETERSPTKRKSQNADQLRHLRDDIDIISKLRMQAIHDRLNKKVSTVNNPHHPLVGSRSQSINEQKSELEAKIEQVEKDIKNLRNAEEGSDEYITSILTGTLEEYSTKDLLPMLLMLRSKLQGEKRQICQQIRVIEQEEKDNPDHGIHVERQKIALLRAKENEMGIISSAASIQSSRRSKMNHFQGLKRRSSLPCIPSKDTQLQLKGAIGNRYNLERKMSWHGQQQESSPSSQAEIYGQKAYFTQRIRKDFLEAENLYIRAIQVNPNHAVNLGNYALFLQMHKKKYDEAEEHFLRAIDADPLNATILSNYANFLKRIHGDNNRAEEYYMKAIEVDPMHVGNLGNYANFAYHVKNDCCKAEKYFLQALELEPNHVNNLAQYASLLGKLNRTNEAEAYFTRAIKAGGSSNSNVMGNYANFLKKLERYSEAKESYVHALSMDPNNPIVSRNYALFLRDFPEMRKGYSQSISMHPLERKRYLETKLAQTATSPSLDATRMTPHDGHLSTLT